MTAVRSTSKGRAVSAAKVRHGHAMKGRKSPEYLTWASIIRRCTNPRQAAFADYGARGVTVSPTWRGPGGFERFLAELGPKPTPRHTIDRIDNSRGYEPGNCRWVTHQEQQHNRGSNHWIEAAGERLLLVDWARRLGCGTSVITNRIGMYGWSPERAVTTPVRRIQRRGGQKPGS